MRLSRVCRRFRNLALSASTLWTSLCNTHTPFYVEQALARSERSPLTLTVFCEEGFGRNPYSCNSINFIRRVQPEFYRVSSLTVMLVDDINVQSASWGTIRKTMQLFVETHFPRLERLELVVPVSREDDDDDDENENEDEEEEDEDSEMESVPDEDELDHDDDLYHIYSMQNTPGLRFLKLTGILPRVHFGISLRKLDLTFATNWHYVDQPISKLMQFLRSQPALEVVRIKGFNNLEEADFILQWQEFVHLPNLRCLQILASSKQPALNRYSNLPSTLFWLSVPSVEHMNIEFPIDYDAFTLDSLFPRHFPYPRLQNLELELRNNAGGTQISISPFKTILERFPELRFLKLAAFGVTLGWDVPCPLTHPPPALVRADLLVNTDIDQHAQEQLAQYIGNCTRSSRFNIHLHHFRGNCSCQPSDREYNISVS